MFRLPAPEASDILVITVILCTGLFLWCLLDRQRFHFVFRDRHPHDRHQLRERYGDIETRKAEWERLGYSKDKTVSRAGVWDVGVSAVPVSTTQDPNEAYSQWKSWMEAGTLGTSPPIVRPLSEQHLEARNDNAGNDGEWQRISQPLPGEYFASSQYSRPLWRLKRKVGVNRPWTRPSRIEPFDSRANVPQLGLSDHAQDCWDDASVVFLDDDANEFDLDGLRIWMPAEEVGHTAKGTMDSIRGSKMRMETAGQYDEGRSETNEPCCDPGGHGKKDMRAEAINLDGDAGPSNSYESTPNNNGRIRQARHHRTNSQTIYHDDDTTYHESFSDTHQHNANFNLNASPRACKKAGPQRPLPPSVEDAVEAWSKRQTQQTQLNEAKTSISSEASSYRDSSNVAVVGVNLADKQAPNMAIHNAEPAQPRRGTSFNRKHRRQRERIEERRSGSRKTDTGIIFPLPPADEHLLDWEFLDRVKQAHEALVAGGFHTEGFPQTRPTVPRRVKPLPPLLTPSTYSPDLHASNSNTDLDHRRNPGNDAHGNVKQNDEITESRRSKIPQPSSQSKSSNISDHHFQPTRSLPKPELGESSHNAAKPHPRTPTSDAHSVSHPRPPLPSRLTARPPQSPPSAAPGLCKLQSLPEPFPIPSSFSSARTIHIYPVTEFERPLVHIPPRLAPAFPDFRGGEHAVVSYMYRDATGAWVEVQVVGFVFPDRLEKPGAWAVYVFEGDLRGVVERREREGAGL